MDPESGIRGGIRVGSGSKKWDPGPKSGIHVQNSYAPPMKKRDPVEPTEGFIILKMFEGLNPGPGGTRMF